MGQKLIVHRINAHRAAAYSYNYNQPTHNVTPIVRKVVPYDDSAWRRPPVPKNEVCIQGITFTINQWSSKVNYIAWLATLPFKRGDYVVNKRANKPYLEGNYLRVNGLSEVMMLTKHHEDGRMMPLELAHHSGTKFFATVDEWIVVDPPKAEWQFDLGPQ